MHFACIKLVYTSYNKTSKQPNKEVTFKKCKAFLIRSVTDSFIRSQVSIRCCFEGFFED